MPRKSILARALVKGETFKFRTGKGVYTLCSKDVHSDFIVIEYVTCKLVKGRVRWYYRRRMMGIDAEVVQYTEWANPPY